MSEAELHILKARMLEGRRAKARRGELGKPVPMGYLRRPSGEVVLDPDEQAQSTLRLVFELFQRFRTVGKVLRYLVEHDIRMPVRTPGGPGKGELEWRPPTGPRCTSCSAIRSTPASTPMACGRPTGVVRSRDGQAPGDVRRVLRKPRCSCRIGHQPTSPASSSSAIRHSFAPTGRIIWARLGPALHCCRACWSAASADCAWWRFTIMPATRRATHAPVRT